MKQKIKARTTTEYELVLERAELMKLLTSAGLVPEDAKVSITVDIPAGGDYSGITLDIDKDVPLTIRWKIVS